MRTHLLLATALLSAHLAALRGLPAAETTAPLPPPAATNTVGHFGEAGAFTFEGMRSLTASDLWRGLKVHTDFQLAAHPCAPPSELGPTVERALLQGYRHAGFPEASIAASLDASNHLLRVKVQEGPRFNCREIRITGLHRITADQLQSLLRADEPQPLDVPMPKPPTEISWPKGEPAWFDQITRWQAQVSITNALAELGSFAPSVEVRPVANPDGRTADLLIEIQDEGVPGVVAEITVEGLRQNSWADLMNFLEVRKGMTISRNLVARLEERLWRSARFLKTEVALKPLAERGQVSLEFNLREYKDAPAMTNKFSALEESCLRLRDWLVEWPSRSEDLVVSAQFRSVPWTRGLDFELTSSDHGFALVCRSDTGPNAVRYAVLASTNSASLFSGARQRQWQSPGLTVQLKQFLDIGPTQAPEDEPQFNITFGAGFASAAPGPPILLQMKLAPVAFLHAAHTVDRTATIQNGLVTIAHVSEDHHTNQIQFEEKTGRLLQFTSTSQGAEIAFRLFFEPGHFDRAHQQILGVIAGADNQYRPHRPLSSAVAFLLSDLVRSPLVVDQPSASEPGPTPVAAALEGLLTGGLLDPLDRLALDSGATFSIPKPPPETTAAALDSALADVAGLLLAESDDLFPRGSWLWSVAREAAFTLSRHNRYTVPELNRIVGRADTGPVACLTAALFLGMLNADAESAAARDSLRQRLSPEGFRQDWRPLFTGDAVLSQCLQKLAASLAQAKPEEVEALAGLLPSAEAELLRDSVRGLREHRDQAPADALVSPFDRYFSQVLKKRLRL